MPPSKNPPKPAKQQDPLASIPAPRRKLVRTTPTQMALLQACHARTLPIGPSKDDIEQLAQSTGLTTKFIRDWMRRQNKPKPPSNKKVSSIIQFKQEYDDGAASIQTDSSTETARKSKPQPKVSRAPRSNRRSDKTVSSMDNSPTGGSPHPLSLSEAINAAHAHYPVYLPSNVNPLDLSSIPAANMDPALFSAHIPGSMYQASSTGSGDTQSQSIPSSIYAPAESLGTPGVSRQELPDNTQLPPYRDADPQYPDANTPRDGSSALQAMVQSMKYMGIPSEQISIEWLASQVQLAQLQQANAANQGAPQVVYMPWPASGVPYAPVSVPSPNVLPAYHGAGHHYGSPQDYGPYEHFDAQAHSSYLTQSNMRTVQHPPSNTTIPQEESTPSNVPPSFMSDLPIDGSCADISTLLGQTFHENQQDQDVMLSSVPSMDYASMSLGKRPSLPSLPPTSALLERKSFPILQVPVYDQGPSPDQHSISSYTPSIPSDTSTPNIEYLRENSFVLTPRTRELVAQYTASAGFFKDEQAAANGGTTPQPDLRGYDMAGAREAHTPVQVAAGTVAPYEGTLDWGPRAYTRQQPEDFSSRDQVPTEQVGLNPAKITSQTASSTVAVATSRNPKPGHHTFGYNNFINMNSMDSSKKAQESGQRTDLTRTSRIRRPSPENGGRSNSSTPSHESKTRLLNEERNEQQQSEQDRAFFRLSKEAQEKLIMELLPALADNDPFQAAMGLVFLSRNGVKW